MKPGIHATASVPIALLIWFLTRSIYATIAFYITSIIVDIDHIFEFVVHHGPKDLSIKNLYQACEDTAYQTGNYRFKKIYLLFHSTEMVILLLPLSVFIKNYLFRAAALGYITHMTIDWIGNPLYFSSYFTARRIAKNFDAAELLNKKSTGLPET